MTRGICPYCKLNVMLSPFGRLSMHKLNEDGWLGRPPCAGSGEKPIGAIASTPEFFIEGYRVQGPRTVVKATSDGDTIFVYKSKMRGAGWLRFVKKISAPGHWVTWSKTKTEALKGRFG